MPSEETTPPGSHRSGEWPVWASVLEEQGRRVEKELRGLRSEFNEHAQAFVAHVGEDKVLALKVANLEERQKAADEDKRQMSTGSKLAILSAFLSPAALILFQVFKH